MAEGLKKYKKPRLMEGLKNNKKNRNFLNWVGGWLGQFPN